MKKPLFLLLICVFSSLSLFAQKPTRAEKKALRLAAASKEYQLLKEQVKSRQFVLKASQFYTKENAIHQLSPDINFILLKEDQGTIQLNFQGVSGWNGIGGYTLEGQATNLKIKYNDKRQRIFLSMNIQDRANTYFVTFDINSNGRTMANIQGLGKGQMSFGGQLVSLQASEIFKGMSRH